MVINNILEIQRGDYLSSRQKQYVVGVGASAGGLEAIQSLISNLPEKIPNTSIIIAQHLSADYKSVLPQLLARKTKIKVISVKEGLKLQPGRIYISPPTDDLLIENNRFKLKKSSGIGAHPSINTLFASIAKAYGAESSGVVLSGTGEDGTKGIEEIKSVGGLVIAQDPATAKYEGLPSLAISTGMVDEVMEPSQIGQSLQDLLKSTRKMKKAPSQGRQDAVSNILKLLEQRKGIDFNDYKVSTLHRRIQKRIGETKFKNKEEYLNSIIENPEELDRLFQVMLIGVTTFFRNPETFEAINKYLEQIIKSKRDNDKLRIWVPGCATGEEVYTCVILIKEILEKLDKQLDFQIFATDIDSKALHIARLGIYSARSVKNVPSDILKKYFKKRDKTTYQIDKSLRMNVLFSRHDVKASPPFLRLDLISCRNLLIYFNSALQKRVIPLFHYALNPDGFLVLGKSENISSFKNLFSTIDSRYKIFQRKLTNNKDTILPHLTLGKNKNIVTSPKNIQKKNLTIADMVKETIYNSYEHPYVVVDGKLDIIEIYGDISKFTKMKQGVASLNIVKLLIPELQMGIRTLSSKVLAEMKPIIGPTLRIKFGREHTLIRLVIKPLLYSRSDASFFIIIFEEIQADNKSLSNSYSKNSKNNKPDPRIIELEQELDAIKEHASTLVEELETSNEQLQAMNEEMQAANEELQVSNEELETSNEELQVSNEELENAYAEIRQANNEITDQKQKLSSSEKNLKTMLSNTLVGFILIDHNYRILEINNTAEVTINNLSGITLSGGESYAKIIGIDKFTNFQKNFKKALSGVEFASVESYKFKDNQTRVFNINYSPVKVEKDEKKARYVVLSMIDITDLKQAEGDLKKANKNLFREKQFMNSLAENLLSLIWTMDSGGNFTYCNKSYLEFVGEDFENIKRNDWTDIVHPDDKKKTEKMWQVCAKGGNCLDIEHRLKNKAGEYKWFITYAEPIYKEDKSVNFWLGISTEIDSMKRKSAELEYNISRLTEQRKELMRLNKTKDDFIALASHQLRTPASAVKQYIKLVLDEYAGPYSDEQGRYLETAYSSNERQLNIINDLLKTAQLDSEGYNVNKEPSSLVELCCQIIEELKPVSDLKNQKVELNYGEKDIKFPFDKSEIKLVIENLIINATKYSYDNTAIQVKIAFAKKFAKVSVIDRGVGLTKNSAKQIFGKFTRIDNSLSDTVSGTGLGLYISKKIIEAHAGSIVGKPNKSEGSTFIVKLPL